MSDYLEEIYRSGCLSIRNQSEKTRRRQLRSYLDGIIAHDFEENGITINRPQTV